VAGWLVGDIKGTAGRNLRGGCASKRGKIGNRPEHEPYLTSRSRYEGAI